MDSAEVEGRIVDERATEILQVYIHVYVVLLSFFDGILIYFIVFMFTTIDSKGTSSGE